MLSSTRMRGGRPREDLAGREVLVIADDFCEGRDTVQALQHSGFKVTGPLRNAESALRAVAARAFNCAVIDLDMGEEQQCRVASALIDKGALVVFIGGESRALPEQLMDAPRLVKPTDYRALISLIAASSVPGSPENGTASPKPQKKRGGSTGRGNKSDQQSTELELSR